MNGISESELTLVVKSRAIKRMHIVQTEMGRFRIHVTLNNQEGELELLTFRKKPREWASLDRLTKHIREKLPNVPNITISLQPPTEAP
jgi:hypothetical protein